MRTAAVYTVIMTKKLDLRTIERRWPVLLPSKLFTTYVVAKHSNKYILVMKPSAPESYVPPGRLILPLSEQGQRLIVWNR